MVGWDGGHRVTVDRDDLVQAGLLVRALEPYCQPNDVLNPLRARQGKFVVSLQDEVDSNRRNIRSDGYTMSIGEAANMYRDREIVITPEYQRLFRWTIEQQSRLIESILLDIPLPPIFVAQREDGVWEVVDAAFSGCPRYLSSWANCATRPLSRATSNQNL